MTVNQYLKLTTSVQGMKINMLCNGKDIPIHKYCNLDIIRVELDMVLYSGEWDNELIPQFNFIVKER